MFVNSWVKTIIYRVYPKKKEKQKHGSGSQIYNFKYQEGLIYLGGISIASS
jgi:hypothetical protein